MSITQFVHLRLHSEFSVVDGIVRIDDAIAKAATDGQGALALTDSANMFGAVRFYLAARKRGIKPIIGCDLWITNDIDRDNPTRMVVLVQNRAGYLNLCELITRAYLENPHRNRAEVRIEWFEEGQGRSARGADCAVRRALRRRRLLLAFRQARGGGARGTKAGGVV